MHRVVSQKIKRGLALAAVAAAALIAGCGGGGTSQIEAFAPNRIIAFGDETGAILQSGKKYTINALDASTQQIDCASNPVWTQSLASGFGFVFPECNTSYVALPQGIMYATPGAKVADVRDKIDYHLSNDRFGPKDLVAIMVGVNDILELYKQYPAVGRDSLLAEAKARGTLLAQQANRIANANGRVVISTIFDVGLTPYGQNEKLQQTDIDRSVLMKDLTTAFNTAMRLALLNDGRLIGLVLTDETIELIAKYPSLYSFTNVTDTACRSDIAPQDCTTDSLKAEATSTWLWASDTTLSPTAQQRIGSMALSRAKNNPF
ncbi:SGNH/GDSL hydrolase family protein [Roseateles sp. BYS78W]|uniref:SGNH/GDSL hydrolase family protein n=1 Tax=Pelomonas candidula TaxID=3299025 RepID=A0ABW7HAF6_9BURK